MKITKLQFIFYAVLINSLLVVAEFFIPPIRNLFRGTFLFLLPLATFSFLGIVLTILTYKEKNKGTFRKLLFLTGLSSAGFFICTILHNVFYALNILSKDIFLLNNIMEILHVLFFLTSIFICPACFLVGMLGSLIYIFQKRGF